MAKHNIGATSTVCGASKHTWLRGIATNYRQCGQCRTVEVLVDGQWVSPTGRTKRAHDVIVPARSWTDDAGVNERDLQAKVTRLVELPGTVKPLNVPTVSLSTESVATRRELGEKLFAWATEYGYPQLQVHIPARVYPVADASEICLEQRVHTIVSGVAAWRGVCYQSPQSLVEAALEVTQTYKSDEWPDLREEEKERRLALIEYARARSWRMFTFKTTKPEMAGYQFTLILGGEGESGWVRFAHVGDYEQVVQACEHLERDQRGDMAKIIDVVGEPRADVTLEDCKKWLLGAGERFGYPAVRFRLPGDGVVYTLPGKEFFYRERAEKATLRWLWSAVQAIDGWARS